jgi:mannitol/fructose-specific phosphotransferase system IIA component (Ntr-type)
MSDPSAFEPVTTMYVRQTSKNAIIREMLDALMDDSLPADIRLARTEREGILDALLERESLGPTGIGEAVAMPHAKHAAVPKFIAAVAFLRTGIPWEGPDTILVTTVMLCVSPFGSPAVYLNHMAAAMRAVRDPETIKRWRYLMG